MTDINNHVELSNHVEFNNHVDLSNHVELGPFGGIVSTVSWQLPFYLNLLATIGPDAAAGGVTPTTGDVFDAILGTVEETTPAGVPFSEFQRYTIDPDETDIGADFIIGGDFETPADWDTAGLWVVSDGVAKVVGGSGSVTQTSDETLLEGYPYLVTLTILNRVSGQVTPAVGGGTGTGITTDGTFQQVVTAGSSQAIGFVSGGGSTVQVDDYSAQLITPEFKNSLSKSNETLLHPVNIDGVFLVHPAWANATVYSAGSFSVGFVGVQAKYYQTVAGGTSDGTTPVDDVGVVWVEQGNYSNGGGGYLPHIKSRQGVDSFSSAVIPETGKDRWRLAFENLGAQTFISDGTNSLTYTGTAIEFTDGVTTLTHIVTPIHGDFVGLDEETGTLYYNGIIVDVDGTLDVTWGAITAINNVVDILDDSGVDLTDSTWQEP